MSCDVACRHTKPDNIFGKFEDAEKYVKEFYEYSLSEHYTYDDDYYSAAWYYAPNQLLFRTTVQNYVINAGLNFFDGTSNIIRHTDTRTTHSDRSGNGGNGPKPYPGITKDTCDIKNIQGKDILLIDDLYTKHICIDEDAIQALYDNGANRVVFYSVGKTVSN